MKKSFVLIISLLIVLLVSCAEETSKSGGEGKEKDDSFPKISVTRIKVDGNKFMANGQQIFMNGANTPWHSWGNKDFGLDGFDAAWWDDHYSRFNKFGLNSTRVWVCLFGNASIILIDSDGYVSGASDKHWADLDEYFEIARKNGVYVMATLMSFDFFSNIGYADRWGKWVSSEQNIDSYINNYLIPFVERYGDNPALWAIDIMNEPAWVTTHENENSSITFEMFQLFFAKAAKAIHENSDILVTVGISDIKYNSDSNTKGRKGNMVSDSRLRAKVDDPNATLDFWSTHWYEWTQRYQGYASTQTPKEFGLDDSKPSVIGEVPGIGTSEFNNLGKDIENAYLHGWVGFYPWTSNNVDDEFGGWSDVSKGATYFANKYTSAVYTK